MASAPQPALVYDARVSAHGRKRERVSIQNTLVNGERRDCNNALNGCGSRFWVDGINFSKMLK